MVDEMSKVELENKCDMIYREIVKNVIDRMKMQLTAYSVKVNLQGYDTVNNFEKTLRDITNKAYSEFDTEFNKSLNEKLTKDEIELLNKRIMKYRKEVNKILKEFVVTTKFLARPSFYTPP